MATQEVSEICQFLKDKSIFLTGGTGFLGKILVEKLLRTCDVKNIYLLMRMKKNVDINERFNATFNVQLFDSLRELKPNFMEKLRIISGDIALPDLGIDEVDKQLLINEVNVVYHCAATVRFDQPLRAATYINVRAVWDLVNMAKQMKQLQSMVHVSTAYSFCTRLNISEVVYEPAITGKKLLELLDGFRDETLDAITPSLIGKWPNTYVFTKCIAETVVQTEGKDLPIAIFRPSIVTNTSEEPVPGWIDNFYGPVGAAIAIAIGVVRTFYVHANKVVDLIPADYVVNGMIAASYETQRSPQQVIKVYNCVSGVESPITWKKYTSRVTEEALKIPTLNVLWYYGLTLSSYKWVHNIRDFYKHFLPALIIDLVLRCIGKKPVLMAAYNKFNSFLEVITHFATNQFTFTNTNIQALWNNLNETDQSLFKFSMAKFDWDSYLVRYVKGARIFILKDPMDTVPQGLIKYRKLKIIHYTFMTLIWALIAYLLYTCVFLNFV